MLNKLITTNRAKKTSVSSFSALTTWLQAHHDTIQCVSFDIFDTLLARHIEPPLAVQKAVCRHVRDYLNQHCSTQAPWSLEVILSARQTAEKALREQAVQQGLDYECRFSDLVQRWIEVLFPEQAPTGVDIASLIITKELELENQALFVKAGVLELLQDLKAQGKVIIAISDMYLDGQYIKVILSQKQLLDYFDHVYVSSDQTICKYSGRIFEQVIQDCQHKHQITAKQIVHIGDNPVSDCRMPHKKGLNAIWLYEPKAIKRRKRQALSSKMAERQSIWSGRFFFEGVAERIKPLQTASQRQRTQQDFFYRYGLSVLAPAFCVFTQALTERLRTKPVDKLFFVARDGYLFHKLFQKTNLNAQISNDYIYMSRRVITAASVADGLTRDQAQVAFYNPKQQGLHSVFRVYGLLHLGLETLASQHGFQDIKQPLHDWHDPRLLSFLQDQQVQTIIRQQGKQQKALLEAYLEQTGFFAAKTLALVDIGWNGTIQKFLKQTFGQRKDFPILYGYYFAFVPKLYSDFGDNNFSEGLIHDSRRGNACERIPAEVEEIFEQAARSPEGTTLNYIEQDGCIVPQLKPDTASDRQAEIHCNAWIASIQDGIFDHFEHYQVMQQLTGYRSHQLLPYVYGLLERAVVYPTKEETQYLTRLVHTEDFGHDHVLDIGKEAITFKDFLQPMVLIKRIELTAWRYALFANLPTYVANFMFRILFLYSVKK